MITGPFIAIGLSTFSVQGDGIWYQQRYPHTIRRESAAGEFGYRWPNVEVGYRYLGRVTSDALADPNDARYASGEMLHDGKIPRWVGSGAVHGPYASYVIRIGRFDLGVGVMAAKMTWRQSVYGWYGDGGETMDFHFSSAKWKVVPTASIGFAADSNVLVNLAAHFGVELKDGAHPGEAGHKGKSAGISLYRGSVVSVNVRYKF